MSQRSASQRGGLRGSHLGPDVLETGRADDREADEEDVGLRVTERSQAVIILLSSRVPQSEVDRLAVDHDIRRVVVEHGWYVFALEVRRGGCSSAFHPDPP